MPVVQCAVVKKTGLAMGFSQIIPQMFNYRLIRAVKEKYRALGWERHLIPLVIMEYKSQGDSILFPFDYQTLRSCVIASVGEDIDCYGPLRTAGKEGKQMHPLWKPIW